MSTFPAHISKVDEIDCQVVPWDWPFAQDRDGEIARNWARRVAIQPRLFDGRVMLAHQIAVGEEAGRQVLRSAWFETGYSAFLAWRDFGYPDLSVRNGFAMAALRASDGGFVLAQMGAHTANPGHIYFACGTPDPDDVTGNRLDLEGSALRELTEETGLAESEVTVAPGWTLVETGGLLAFFKDVRIDLPAREAVAEIEARLARQDDPELAGMYAVTSAEDLRPGRMPQFILAYLDHMMRRTDQPG
jgi:8-oxo-dGTP pyrophosphatase MutT (NUDIX family)